MIVKPIQTRIFEEGEHLLAFITKHIRKVPENSVLVVTSKIIALAEERTESLGDELAKERLIKREGGTTLKTKYVWLSFKDGMMMANAGIDESNASGKYILLPKDSFASATSLRKKLRTHYKIKNLGILITDSHTSPLRAGVTGIALGYAGFKGLRDYRGAKDIFGRKFKFSQTDVADSLAAAAVLVMGEGNEQIPLSLITDAPVEFTEKIDRDELVIGIEDDMYAPLFSHLRTSAKKRLR